jgi:hypothetical protein
VQPEVLLRVRSDRRFDHEIHPRRVGDVVAGRIAVERWRQLQQKTTVRFAEVAEEHDR